ncbi:N/A [soil metagenome]
MAAELAQEALIRTIERWPQVSAMEAPEAWAYRVAFNLARSQLRRRLAERRAHARSGRPATTSWNVDVAGVLVVRAAVAALPPRQRQAVVLRYFGDLSTDQTAAATGCRPGTVKAHLHQALANLRAAGLTGIDAEPGPRGPAPMHSPRSEPTPGGARP